MQSAPLEPEPDSPQVVLDPTPDVFSVLSPSSSGLEYVPDRPRMLCECASSANVVSPQPGSRFTTLSSLEKFGTVPPEQASCSRRAARLMQKANERVGKPSLRFAERHWVLAPLLFVVATIGVGFAVGWIFPVRSFQGVINLAEVQLFAHIVMLVWYNCPEDAMRRSEECPDVNVYFDMNLLRASGQSSRAANNDGHTPIFTVNATTYKLYDAGSDNRYNSPQFRTYISMTTIFDGSDGRSIQAYPFNKYLAELAFWAESSYDNQSIAIGLIGSSGVVPGFDVVPNIDFSDDLAHNVTTKTFTVTRSQGVRIYAILIVIAVWMITITLLLICIISVVLGKGIEREVLVLPVTNLFVFTQLRSTLPGAPSGFGADIDYVGVLPCLVLLTFSSVLMCAVFLFRDREKHAPRWIRRHPETVETVTA
ncbi:hypothetical protein FOMPIDRAFT_90585 [Fomitopsis schrenkii]|uniref:Uncharacterized protein n=1 Tax=Fomitopsis schrenkii TaxID=2126942 RepID=S8F235_FOMSC|nr:hypothetical protein FOMPIDRAFT_90585 [Fomitopsis schrenkii]